MLLAAALLLPTPAADRPDRLVGAWAIVAPHRDAALPVEPCATDWGVAYTADGRWRDFSGEEEGVWRRRGDRVTERVTGRIDDVTGGIRRVREPAYAVRLRWLGPDHVNAAVDGETHGLIRCPPEPAR